MYVQWFLEESHPANKISQVPSGGGNFVSCEQPQRGAGDFMLLKYRADLCYSLKDFSSAAVLFEQVLELLPPLNAMVKREVVDSLARCYSHLGQHELAQESAKQMVWWYIANFCDELDVSPLPPTRFCPLMTVMLHHGNYSLNVKKVLEIMKVWMHIIALTFITAKVQT